MIMPIYEFECTECGAIKEEVLSIKSETREVDCHECGNVSRRIVSSNTFHLAGSGWAADGYFDTKHKLGRALRDI